MSLNTCSPPLPPAAGDILEEVVVLVEMGGLGLKGESPTHLLVLFSLYFLNHQGVNGLHCQLLLLGLF